MITKEKAEQWAESKANLNTYKQREILLRKMICKDAFNGSHRPGLHKVAGEGFTVKATYKTQKRLDTVALEFIYDDLSPQALKCIKFKPVLVEKELKELDQHDPLWDLITISEATPTLEVKFND